MQLKQLLEKIDFNKRFFEPIIEEDGMEEGNNFTKMKTVKKHPRYLSRMNI